MLGNTSGGQQGTGPMLGGASTPASGVSTSGFGTGTGGVGVGVGIF